MTEGTKKLLKILAIPFALFLTYPIALGFKIYYALETHQPEIPRDIRVEYNYDQYKHSENTGNRVVDTILLNSSKTSLHIGDNEIKVSVTNKEDGKPVVNGVVKVEISRKATTIGGASATCKTDDGGNCTLTLKIPEKGYWDALVVAEDPAGKFTRLTNFTIDG